MKLLVDECLSEELAKLARERGHPNASHVRWLGKDGAKDWELMPVIVCLNGPVGMDLDLQLELFELALDELATAPDLIDQVIDVTLENGVDEEIRVVRYALPAENSAGSEEASARR